MKYNYVLFDLDGTLLDTNELILRSFEHALEVYAPGAYTRADILPHMGKPLVDQMQTFCPDHPQDEVIRTYRTYNLDQHDALVEPFPYVAEVLQRLHAEGVKLAVVTSKIRLTTEKGLELCKITPYFDAVITVDEVDKHKPHPEPVLKAMEALGAVPEETLMVGDSPYDIQAGQAAGTKTVGVKWSLRGEEGLREFAPDYLIGDLRELEAIVRGESN